MRTLFIDLASHAQLIAIADEKNVLASASVESKTGEQQLIPLIDQLLKKSQCTYKDIDRIAATTGPGGFMSLRVGLSLANALTDSLDIPIAGIHLSDLWAARVAPSSPNPFSRREKGEAGQMGDEKKAMNPMILKFARTLRKESTEAEKILWQSLRNSQIGFKFRRQHPIQQRILDFYCHEFRLGIELDGSVHDNPDQRVYDSDGTEVIGELGIQIIRFRNEEVLENLNAVIARIKNHLRSPLPSGEGLGARVLWLHSTKQNLLFIHGFGDLKKEWPEPILVSIEELGLQLKAYSSPLFYAGELIDSQKTSLAMLTPMEGTSSIEEVLPEFLNKLSYEKKSLIPWYGRGA